MILFDIAIVWPHGQWDHDFIIEAENAEQAISLLAQTLYEAGHSFVHLFVYSQVEKE